MVDDTSYMIRCSYTEYLSCIVMGVNVLCITCTAVASIQYIINMSPYPVTSLVSASSVLASVPAMY